MDRRRLVDTARDRLKIGNIENPGILVAVPADDVKGMEVVPVAGNECANFDAYLKVAALGMRRQLLRAANIAVIVGRMLQELPITVEIAPRRLD